LLIIYIDHRIENFTKVGDRITILRDGRITGTLAVADYSREKLIKLMVGRDLASIYPKTSTPGKDIHFAIRNYSNAKLTNIDFAVRKGEVFGLAGLVGAGRSEVMRSIFGIDPLFPGAETFIHGYPVHIDNPRDAIRQGIAFVPEDRKAMGFVPDRSINFNLVIPSLEYIGRSVFVNTRLEKEKADSQRLDLNVRSLNYHANLRELSGGNQQKIVIGKWLMRQNIEVLLLDEPTRGIDIGAKMEIYKLIDTLARRGKVIVLVTSEMPELIGLCDRIATLSGGRLTRVFEKREFSQEDILAHCI
jgi:ABC-type sugar transport system ATPase subunit